MQGPHPETEASSLSRERGLRGPGRARPGWGRSWDECAPQGRPGRAVGDGPGRSRAGSQPETHGRDAEAFRPGVRRPRRPQHGLGSRELRAQRRPELGLPRLPRLLRKLPSPALLCDIVRLPPSLGSAPAAPGHLWAPASCALRPHCGEAGVERGLRAAWQAARPGRASGCPRLPATLPSPLPRHTLTYCRRYSGSLRSRGGRENPSLWAPGQQQADSYVTHGVLATAQSGACPDGELGAAVAPLPSPPPGPLAAYAVCPADLGGWWAWGRPR